MSYRKEKVLPFDMAGCSGTGGDAALTRLHFTYWTSMHK